MRSAAYILQNAVHLLRAVAHADGEDQERHEDRIGIEHKAHQRQQAQLPHHSDQRADDHHRRGAPAADVIEQEAAADENRHCEEEQEPVQSADQVAQHLGEASDVNRDLRARIFGPDRLQLLGKIAVIQRLAGG